MATRTLLNEAIAEAESIKEAALANAKAALEESFAPSYQRIVFKKSPRTGERRQKRKRNEGKRPQRRNRRN